MAVAGSDFVRLAAQYSTTATAKQDGGELGWQLVSTLDPQVHTAVQALPAGGISDILQRQDNSFEIYKVTEAQTDRDLDSTQLSTLLKQKTDAWFTQETANVKVERDISSGESDWLMNHIITDAQKRGVAATPTPTAPGGGSTSGQ
jgi:parvulin-like peptidyl-prolyl isomerase